MVGRAGRGAPPPLDAFLAELGARLDSLGPDGTRAAIERRAATVRPSERAELLGWFEADIPATPLLEIDGAIDDLVDAVAALPPQGRWNRRGWWDDDDGSLAEAAELEDLLIAVGERFAAGEVVWATAALGTLFDVAVDVLDDDRGIDLTLDHDLATEAAARLAVGLLLGDGAVDARVDQAVAVLCRIRVLGACPSAVGLRSAAPPGQELSDAVLRAFADALWVSAPATWEGRQQRELCLDVVSMLDGLDRAIETVRVGDAGRLDAYRWIVERLVEAGDGARAAALADEAIEGERDSPGVAALADRSAELWAGVGDPARALAARTRAWRAGPDVRRLERLLDAADGDDGAPVADIVGDAAGAGQHLDGFLAAAVALLAGDLDAVQDAATAVLGSARRVARLAEPWSWGAAQLAIAAGSAVAQGSVGPLHRRVMADATAAASRPDSWRDQMGRDGTEPATPLSERLTAAVGALPPDPSRLDGARRLLDRAASAVMGAKARSSYRPVAEMVVVVAAAAAAVDGTPVEVTVDAYDQRYRRFSAFRRELRSAVEGQG